MEDTLVFGQQKYKNKIWKEKLSTINYLVLKAADVSKTQDILRGERKNTLKSGKNAF